MCLIFFLKKKQWFTGNRKVMKMKIFRFDGIDFFG